LWLGRRRMQRLENEIATAKAERAELQRRLAFFERIAAAAGGGTATEEHAFWTAAVPGASMPASLLAAAAEQSPHEVPVRLDVGGADVIAVIGGPGDPRAWWSAVWRVAGKADEAS
jgi:hypothetical protein